MNTETSDNSLDIFMKKEKGLWSCTQCEKTSSQKSNLRNHIETKHNAEILECKECKTIFNTRDDMDIHVKEVHKFENRFTCNECGEEYSEKKLVLSLNFFLSQ